MKVQHTETRTLSVARCDFCTAEEEPYFSCSICERDICRQHEQQFAADPEDVRFVYFLCPSCVTWKEQYQVILKSHISGIKATEALWQAASLYAREFEEN